jgi:hypothetical protein
MSVSLGIYDFFAYIIPGTLYLFVFNELLRSFGFKFINVISWFQPGQSPNILLFVPVLIAAYIIGHIIDPLAYNFYHKYIYRIRHKKKIYEKQLQYLKEGYPKLNIQFEPRDWTVLFTLLRERNVEITKVIDKYQADSMMLRNIALGTLVLAINYLGNFFFLGSWAYLIVSLGILIISLLAINKSNQFRTWFYSAIYEASLGYGTDLKAVIQHSFRERSGVKKRNNSKKLK